MPKGEFMKYAKDRDGKTVMTIEAREYTPLGQTVKPASDNAATVNNNTGQIHDMPMKLNDVPFN